MQLAESKAGDMIFVAENGVYHAERYVNEIELLTTGGHGGHGQKPTTTNCADPQLRANQFFQRGLVANQKS